MKQITLNIPDNKYSFFLELIQNLEFIKFEETGVPEWHKQMVRERLRNYKSNHEQAVDFDQALDAIEQDL